MNQDFEAIYRLYFTSVYRFILSRCQDPDLADEITSLTFFKALESLDSFRGDGSIDGWLKQIGYRIYLDHLQRTPKTLPEEELEQLPSLDLSPDDQIIEQESVQSIELAIKQLRTPYREVFELRVKEELSYQDIARIFGKTDNWACVTYHRAKRMVQDELKEE